MIHTEKKHPTKGRQYYDLLTEVFDRGHRKVNERTGAVTLSLFGRQMVYDISTSIPLITGRRIPYKSMLAETCWFLSGSTNSVQLNKMGSRVWDEWALTPEDIAEYISRASYAQLSEAGKEADFLPGDLGPIYGEMWRAWPGPDGSTTDQIRNLITGLKTHPMSRRHIVSAWNATFLPDEAFSPQQNVLKGKQALAPCHTLFQVYVRPLSILTRINELPFLCEQTFIQKNGLKDALNMVCDEGIVSNFFKSAFSRPRKFSRIEKVLTLDQIEEVHKKLDEITVPRYGMSLMLYARSQDLPLGTCFNQAQYAILAHMIANTTGMKAEELVYNTGDAHIYENQFAGVETLLNRVNKIGIDNLPPLPSVAFRHAHDNLWDYKPEEIIIQNYSAMERIPFPITV